MRIEELKLGNAYLLKKEYCDSEIDLLVVFEGMSLDWQICEFRGVGSDETTYPLRVNDVEEYIEQVDLDI